MSMAAKTSDRGDNMIEANLQADGLVEEPAQRKVNQQRQKKRTVPLITR